MPNPSPSQEQHDHDLTERERDMQQPEWCVEAGNYREVGEAFSTFCQRYDTYEFTGIAALTIDNTTAILRIELAVDTSAMYRCSVCQKVPLRPTTDNPGICIHCGKKVCGNCARAHQRSHYSTVKTIGGKVMCNGTTVKCGQDQCPTCGGAPF